MSVHNTIIICTVVMTSLVHDVVHVDGVRLCLWTATSNRPVVHPQVMRVESHGRMILTGRNQRSRRETCPSATLPSINYTWTDMDANPGFHTERRVANYLSHGMALASPLKAYYGMSYLLLCKLENSHSYWHLHCKDVGPVCRKQPSTLVTMWCCFHF
jgi:hypothetical protein